MGEIFKRAIPDVSLEWSGERLTNATEGQIEIEHLHRYFLARSMCRGLDVLDVASGEGYGSALLAQVARSVIGVEVSPEAVAHAAKAYQAPNLLYMEGDARSLQLDDASVDVVVSLETIEHFYEHDVFLREVRRVLRPGGRFIVSSPDPDVYSPAGSDANPFHVRELSPAELEKLLCGTFSEVRILAQRLMLGSALISNDGAREPRTLTFEKRGARHFECSDGLPRSAYAVAVASDGQINDIPNSLYIDTDEIGALLDRAAAVDAAATQSVTREELTVSVPQVQSGNAEETGTQDTLGYLHVELTALREQLALSTQLVQSIEAEKSAAQLALVSLQAELTNIVAELEAARAETDDACRQRDATRIAMRRVVSRSVSQDEFDGMRAQLAAQAALTQYWHDRYEGLRARLEAVLHRFGIGLALRFTPSLLRRFVSRRALGPGQS